MTSKSMMQRWVDLSPKVTSVSRALSVYRKVEEAYAQPHRHYHTLRHIEQMLEAAEAYFPDIDRKVLWAIWFHDVIWIPGNFDKSALGANEQLSADYAGRALKALGWRDRFQYEVSDLVLLTVRHRAKSRNGQILCDLDLLSLAADPEVFDANTLQLRKEHPMLSDALWEQGRGAFCDSMLARERIFQTPEMYELFEQKARQNLRREV